MRHAVEEEEKIPLEQVTNFNEVLTFYFIVFLLYKLRWAFFLFSSWKF